MARFTVICAVFAFVVGGCLATTVTEVAQGEPKEGEADYSCQYYSFQVEGGKEASVWLTPLAGDPNLSVKRFDSFGDISGQEDGACRNWGSGTDEYSSTKSDSYDVVSFDASGSGTQYYAIGVWGRQDEGHCRYTVLFHSDTNVHVKLSPNMPQIVKVRAEEIVYFSLEKYQQPEDQVMISLTDIYGDPDLYVAAKSVFDHPDTENYNWRKTSIGADVLLINQESYVSHCDDGQCWAKAGENGFAIGVRGYNKDSEFVISAGDASKATVLASGIPTAGMVQSKQNQGVGKRHYKVYLGEESDDADVFLTKKYGQTSLFANRNRQDWPTGSSDADVSGVVMDRYSEMLTSTGPGPKTMLISVTTPECGSFCYKSLFTVLGHDGQHMTILQNGVEQTGNIAEQGGTANYKFFYDDPQSDVVVTLTRHNNNQDVDLKINLGRAVTSGDADFDGSRWGSEEVTMTAAEIREKHGGSFRGWIYIQALSYHGSNAGYTVVATSTVNPRSLTYGESINESSSKPRYYQIELQNRESAAQVAVVITTYTGSSRIAVAPPDVDGNPSVPKPSYDSTPDSQRFESSTMQYTADYMEGTWSISVEPHGDATSYSILVYTLDEPVELREGMPQGGVVKPDLRNYFFFDLSGVRADTVKKPNIRVRLTCVGGDADLYLDTENSRPTQDAAWKGEHYGNDEYVIHWEDDRIRSDTLYIGVKGFSAFDGDVSYTVVVSLDKSTTTLVTGRATTGSSDHGLASYYQFVPNASNYKVVVTLLRGDANVYISNSKELWKPDNDSCRGTSKCTTLPNTDKDGERVNVITKKMTTGKMGAPVSISVQPRGGIDSISFTIVVTGIGNDGVIRLNPGTVQYGESEPDRTLDVYSLKVDDRSNQKQLTVTLSHQRPWISVCKDTEGPMQLIIGRGYEMEDVTELVDGVTTTVSPVDINVVRATFNVQAGEKYYIGVKTCHRKAGHFQDRIPYSVHYDGDASTPITLGEGDVRPDASVGVYRYHLNRARPLTVNIIPCEGHPRACVTDISTNPNPGQCNIAQTTVAHPTMDQKSSGDLNTVLHKYSSEVFVKVTGNGAGAQFSMCVDQESYCADKLETSNYGHMRHNIQVGLVTDNSISIQWPSPTKTDNTPDNGARVRAFINSVDGVDVPFTNCGLQLMKSKQSDFDLGFVAGSTEQQFNGLTPGTEYILSVAVAEQNDDGTTSYTPYKPLSVITTGVNPNDNKGKHGHHGGFWSGVGWFLFTVILLVSVGMLVYCVGGCIFKHTKMGARGFETIPNVDFWREVPEKTAGCLSGLGGLFKKPIPKPSLAQQRPYERMGGGDSEYVPPEL